MTANTTMKITRTITTIDTSDRLPLGGDDAAVGMKRKTITVQDICTVCTCSFRCYDALGTEGDIGKPSTVFITFSYDTANVHNRLPSLSIQLSGLNLLGEVGRKSLHPKHSCSTPQILCIGIEKALPE